MGFIIQAGETTAAKLRVPLFIVNTDGTEHSASLTGVKARLSINGGTAGNSTNDVVRVDGAQCYVQLTTGEVGALVAGDRMTVKVPVSGTRMMAITIVDVPADNVFAAGPTTATVSAGVWGADSRTLTTTIPSAVENAEAVATELAPTFASLPSAASIITALRAENVTSAWGVSSTPAGGSSIVYTDRRGGTTLGERTAFFDSTGKMVGLSAVA
jgi:hypothetical protein